MKRRNRLKLTTIGILMLVSQIGLAVFVVKWIRSQYLEEQKLFSQQLDMLYIKEHDRMLDSTVQYTISNPLIDSIHLRKHIDAPSVEHFRETIRPAFAAIATTNGEGEDQPFGYINKDSQVLAGAVRTFVVKLSQEVSMPEFISLDSTVFRKRFERITKIRHPEVTISWGNKPANALVITARNVPPWNKGYVSGYQQSLIRKIGPQIGFSALLLLLCGMAFILSYSTVRRQMKLSAQKDGFISNMSHELKTPVATAKVAIEALRKYDAINDPVKTRDYLQMAAWEMDRLEALIGNVLNNVQLEEGRMVMKKQTLNMGRMVEEMVTGMQPLFAEKGKLVSYDISPLPSHVHGDHIHLQGAVYNVLDNAIKYGGSSIDIQLKTDNEQVTISISDDGPGVPEEYKRKIFEKFFRIPSGNVHDVKGYGLGLNYTRFVVKAHNGNIHQENNEKGGATFILSLPMLAS